MNKSSHQGHFEAFDAWLIQVRGRIQGTLGAMLEREVNLSLQPSRKLKPAEFDTLLPDGPIALTIPFGSVGGWTLLLPRKLAAGIADLAALGSGAAEWNEEVHPGTLKEIWGQVVADLEPDIIQLLGEEAQIGELSSSSNADEAIASSGAEPAVVWKINISEWGEQSFIMLVESNFAGAFKSETKEPEPMPATPPKRTPEPAPTQPAPQTSAAKQHGPVARPAAFEDFTTPPPRSADNSRNIDTLLDISLPIIIELGRTRMLVRDVLDLGPGSVIELDKLSGEPVDLYVNDKRFARGEVVVIEENFGVRITELLKIDERLKALR